jgi:hypothetical protein
MNRTGLAVWVVSLALAAIGAHAVRADEVDPRQIAEPCYVAAAEADRSIDGTTYTQDYNGELEKLQAFVSRFLFEHENESDADRRQSNLPADDK